MKPHKGTINNWYKKHWYGRHIIIGDFVDHHEFAGKSGHTSYIVKHDEETGEVETRNSRYTLGTPATVTDASAECVVAGPII
jgi:hypothetical protein